MTDGAFSTSKRQMEPKSVRQAAPGGQRMTDSVPKPQGAVRALRRFWPLGLLVAVCASNSFVLPTHQVE